jgi:hypothetical protein
VIAANAPLMLTASGLAALGVEGLPTTKRGIHRRAARENWPIVAGPNRAQLIVFDELPFDLRLKIRKAMVKGQIRRVGRPPLASDLATIDTALRQAASAIARARRQIKALKL